MAFKPSSAGDVKDAADGFGAFWHTSDTADKLLYLLLDILALPMHGRHRMLFHLVLPEHDHCNHLKANIKLPGTLHGAWRCRQKRGGRHKEIQR